MTLGPLMVDLEGTAIAAWERELLCRPQVGGAILFTRNYASVEQLGALVRDIHALRQPRLLVAVDQEGGRVQRFREGFTDLPAPARLGELHAGEPARAETLAETLGWLMAAELRAVGIDISFAPVLDLAHGVSSIVGDRAWHRAPERVATLAHCCMRGMRRAGMAAVGKHFPGHGAVAADTHVAAASDARPLADIMAADVVAFERMIHYGLPGLMAAHVTYPDADPQPAGYSRFWLQKVLRDELGFEGAVFSDDLSMRAATDMGDHGERAVAALAAGCDMVLICNDPTGAHTALARLTDYEDPAAQVRLARLHGQKAPDLATLRRSRQWGEAVETIRELEYPVIGDLDV